MKLRVIVLLLLLLIATAACQNISIVDPTESFRESQRKYGP
jgi:hypothetical protein